MSKVADIKFQVKFEDGTIKMLTAREIDCLNDKRRWQVFDKAGKPIFKKSFRG